MSSFRGEKKQLTLASLLTALCCWGMKRIQHLDLLTKQRGMVRWPRGWRRWAGTGRTLRNSFREAVRIVMRLIASLSSAPSISVGWRASCRSVPRSALTTSFAGLMLGRPHLSSHHLHCVHHRRTSLPRISSRIQPVSSIRYQTPLVIFRHQKRHVRKQALNVRWPLDHLRATPLKAGCCSGPLPVETLVCPSCLLLWALSSILNFTTHFRVTPPQLLTIRKLPFPVIVHGALCQTKVQEALVFFREQRPTL